MQHLKLPNLLAWLVPLAGVIALLFWLLPPRDQAKQSSSSERGEPSGSQVDSQSVREKILADLGIPGWHAAGIDGKGIRVAVLDLGFRGYREFLGKTLPGEVLVKSCRPDGNLEAKDSQHGIFCAEIIHALAPGVKLLFANWDPDNHDTLLAAVRWACEQHAEILTCSLIMPTWSDGEGGGSIHEKLTALLANDNSKGALFIACTGNMAQRHWAGEFQEGPGHIHLWHSGQPNNRITPWGSEPVSVELYAQPGTAYDLRILDATTYREIKLVRTLEANGLVTGVARLESEKDHQFFVQVAHTGGKPGRFHLAVLAANLEITTAESSIPFPGDGAEVITIGAVDDAGKRQAFSACGPSSRALKPDLVAQVPFPLVSRSQPFGGTSAAAPQAAGLAALLWSRHRHWQAEDVRSELRRAAADLGPSGHDFETGYGRIQLPLANGLQR